MQWELCLPGGFAESLGKDLKNIAPCIPVIAKLQAVFRKAGLPVIHTKECHKPDLSDFPTAKRNRGNPKIKIGDQGPMCRILIDGEEGSDFTPGRISQGSLLETCSLRVFLSRYPSPLCICWSHQSWRRAGECYLENAAPFSRPPSPTPSISIFMVAKTDATWRVDTFRRRYSPLSRIFLRPHIVAVTSWRTTQRDHTTPSSEI